MLRRSLVRAAVPTDLKSWQAGLRRITAWYPQKGGAFIGDLLAGHNTFIQDVPKRYSKEYAKHFAFVEALTITPLFTLAFVHYFSMFCQYPSRGKLLTPLMTELTQKSLVQQQWLEVVRVQMPAYVVGWRLGMLAVQLIFFPAWLLVSAVAPQLVHATVQQIDHILYTKYDTVSEGAPGFVAECATRCLQAQDFHEAQSKLPTDLGVAIVMVFTILYLFS